MSDAPSARTHDVTELFNRVISSTGSARRHAFDELSALITAGQTGFERDFDVQIAQLRSLDVESTQFEIDLRKLQADVLGIDGAL